MASRSDAQREWSIASVTVTYNAADVLGKQLGALLQQSRALNEIVVVDNGSRDATLEILREEYPQVHVLALGKNLGVGAAFSAGLSYASLEKRHDWVWLLDQDSIPKEDALEQLLHGYFLTEQKGRSAGVVASLPKHEATGLSYPGLVWRQRLVPTSRNVVLQPIWFVDATISSGSMIRRDVAETVGLPRADFFIDFVDFEYALRIRHHGFEIAVVRDSILHHTIGTPLTFNGFGYKKAWSDHTPSREYYSSRNQTYFVWHFHPELRPKLFMLERLTRHGMAVLLFSKHRWKSLHMMVMGFFDGRAGRLGIRFVDSEGSESRFVSVESSR